jgi:chondroitin 4-sulfotransferase 11
MSIFYLNSADVVFIHIPKTGGTSIRKGYFGENYQGPEFEMPVRWESHFSFAFVRNPYDRLISAWKMFTRGTSELAASGRADLSLASFLQTVVDGSIPYVLGEKYVWEEHVRHHTLPQVHPYYCLKDAKFIGRFESLEKDFERVCNHLALPVKPLPVRHRTDRGSYRDYFDKETHELAEKYYAADLAELNYTF